MTYTISDLVQSLLVGPANVGLDLFTDRVVENAEQREMEKEVMKAKNAGRQPTRDVDTSLLATAKQDKLLPRKFFIAAAAFYLLCKTLDSGFHLWTTLVVILVVSIVLIPYFMFKYYGNAKMVRYIYRKTNEFLIYDYYDDALEFVDEAVHEYPKNYSVKLTKCMALVLTGNFNNYKTYVASLEGLSQYEEISSQQFIESLNSIVSYFEDVNYMENFEKIISLPKNTNMYGYDIIGKTELPQNAKDNDEVLAYAKSFAKAPMNIYRVLGNLIAAEVLAQTNKEEETEKHLKAAIAFSPSQEVTACIQKHIQFLNG